MIENRWLFVVFHTHSEEREILIRVDQITAIEEFRERRQLSACGSLVRLACGAEYLIKERPVQVSQHMSDVLNAVDK